MEHPSNAQPLPHGIREKLSSRRHLSSARKFGRSESDPTGTPNLDLALLDLGLDNKLRARDPMKLRLRGARIVQELKSRNGLGGGPMRWHLKHARTLALIWWLPYPWTTARHAFFPLRGAAARAATFCSERALASFSGGATVHLPRH